MSKEEAQDHFRTTASTPSTWRRLRFNVGQPTFNGSRWASAVKQAQLVGAARWTMRCPAGALLLGRRGADLFGLGAAATIRGVVRA